MKIFLFFTLLLITYSCGKNSDNQSSETSESMTPEIRTMTDDFMELVNNHRINIGLSPLIHDEGMGTIARKHSQNMANGSVAIGHDGFSDRCSQAENLLGGGNYCAENVAVGQKSVQAAFSFWMNSSVHRANIESARSTHAGFGYMKDSTGRYYWTQLFLEVK